MLKTDSEKSAASEDRLFVGPLWRSGVQIFLACGYGRLFCDPSASQSLSHQSVSEGNAAMYVLEGGGHLLTPSRVLQNLRSRVLYNVSFSCFDRVIAGSELFS